MYAYITSGTYPFLKKLKEKYPNEHILLMQSAVTSQLYHETDRKTLFQSPRKYEILSAYGDFSEEGYIAFNHIPVHDENKPVLEFELKKKGMILNQKKGLIAYRMLRPRSGNTYLIMTMWPDQDSFDKWDETSFMKALQFQKKPASVFLEPMYTSTYFVSNEKLDESNS